MIVDFHTHIFPSGIRQNREKLFPSEPAFKLLYQSPKSRLIGASELVNAMDENGVDKSVIFGFPWTDADTFKMHNDYIMEMVHKYPDRFIGLCCFETSGKHITGETERCLAGGLSGIGELAFYQSGFDDFSLDQLAPVMEICANGNLPVLIHTNEPVGHCYPGKTPNTLAQIYKLINRFANNKIVLAHWGGGIFFFNLLKKDVKDRLQNVYFDTAASPFLYDPGIYQIAIQVIGVDKILFGSDFPLLPPTRYFGEIESIGLTKVQVDKICGENAKKLLNL
jgi:predicted TIM-barrel fold metal-dependent hydrolase